VKAATSIRITWGGPFALLGSQPAIPITKPDARTQSSNIGLILMIAIWLSSALESSLVTRPGGYGCMVDRRGPIAGHGMEMKCVN
jgi:hypothetical protein